MRGSRDSPAPQDGPVISREAETKVIVAVSTSESALRTPSLPQGGGFSRKLKAYVALTKPRVIELLLVSTLLVGATVLIGTISRLFDLMFTGGAYG